MSDGRRPPSASIWRALLPWLWVGLLAGVATWMHQGAVGSQRTSFDGVVPLEYLPSGETARALALGHRPALADVFWIRAVLYFGGEMSQRQQFEWLQQYIEVVTALDPDFKDIYQWGGMVFILRQEEVQIEDVRMANAILEQGTERFPDNWELPTSAMANCSYYATPRDEEERQELEGCRQRFMRIAAFRPGAPPSLALLATQQIASDDVELRPQLCGMIKDIYLLHERDPEIREQLEYRLRSGVCGAAAESELQALRERFDRMHRATYPYVPADLAVQIVPTERWSEREAQRASEE